MTMEAPTFSGINILLVDDNKVNQFLGKKILKNLGILNVTVAGDGATALQMLHDQKFQVLLTDVEMPGMNGYELTAAVRGFNADITIIALTANATAEEKEHALKTGMNDYLSKPYAPAELLDVLQKHVKRPYTVNGIEPVTEETNGDAISQLYILFNHNREDVKNLLLLLHKQLPECLQGIRDGVLRDDFEAIFNNAHKLKSTIKLFNDESMFKLVADITEFSRNRNNTDQIPAMYDELNKKVQDIYILICREIETLT